MNERELDRVLASIVDDGPVEVPDRVIEAALAALPTTPQRGLAAPSWRRLMFKPIAAVAVAVVLIVAAISLELVPRTHVAAPSSPSPTASPSPSPTAPVSTYTSSTFALPLSFPLDQAASTGFRVDESRDILTIVPPGASTDRLVLLPLAATQAVGEGATATADATTPDSLVQVLDARPGVSAVRLKAFDGTEPETFAVAGVDAPVVAVTTDPTIVEPGTPLLRTTSGRTVDVPASPWTLWLMPAPGSAVGDVLAVYEGSGGEPGSGDFGNWAGTFLSILEALEPAR